MDCNNDTPLGFWGTESEAVIARQFPLHKACRDGDAVTLSRLVATSTPDQIVAEDQFYGWTPIHWAAYFGKINCLIGLLRSGVNVNIRTTRFQQTPAHISAFGGHPNCLHELLKSGADFHAKDYLGEIPLHKAARVGNVQCLKTLLNNGTVANIRNNNGHTAGDLSQMQSFNECYHLLVLVEHQSPASQSMETSNGHPLENGTSGSHVTNGNGHMNGSNGHTNDVVSRKRCYDDESIPLLKRPRISADKTIQQNPVVSGLVPPSHKEHQYYESNNGFETTKNGARCNFDVDSKDDVMECASPVSPADNEDFDFGIQCGRAPSPGMDIKPDMADDLQLWSHLHGYGDTAECLPDENDEFPVTPAVHNDTLRFTLNGIRVKGWS